MNFSGLDTHKDNVLVHTIDGNTKTIFEECIPTTPQGFDRLAVLMKDSECVMEAGSTCYQVYDALLERGIKPKVAHPLYLKTYSGLKKTDKIDARRMALMLKAGIIPEAHIPTKETREARDLIKQHMAIVQQRTREINHTRALLLRHHIKTPTTKLFSKKQTTWLQKCNMPTNTQFLLSQSTRQVLFLEEQKKEVDKLIEEKAKANQDSNLLQSIPGIGWFGAYLLTVFIDGIERFHSCDQLVSYAGLAPTIHQSGKTKFMGKINKLGRPEIRWVMVQSAWIAVAIKKSKRFRKIFLKVKRKSGHKKAIVAVARKMLAISYHLLKKKQYYKEDA